MTANTTVTVQHARKITTSGWEIGPRPQPCVCGAPRHKHSGKTWSGGCAQTGCRRYRRDPAHELAERALAAADSTFLADIAAWHARAYPRPRVRNGWGVGPSDAGACRRRIQYRERPPEGLRIAPVDKSAAILGTLYHEILRRARETLYPWRWYEHQVTVAGFDRPGRVDEYDPVIGRVTDYKSVSDRAFDRVVNLGPRPEHWEQVNIYALALLEDGNPVDTVELLYINRATGESLRFPQRFEERRAREARSKLHGILLALDLGQELPRDGDGLEDPMCQHCPFRLTCWNVEEAEAAGRSPESYTILGPDPQDETVAWAAQRVYETRRAKSAAEDEARAAKPLLGGIPDGVYGGWRVTNRTRRVKDYRRFHEEVTQAIAEGRDPAGVPLRTRTEHWVEVRPVHGTPHTTEIEEHTE